MFGSRLISRQRQVSIDFTEKEPGAGVPADQVAVLAYPSQSRLFRQGLFQHRCGIGKHPVAEIADSIPDAICKRGQAPAL